MAATVTDEAISQYGALATPTLRAPMLRRVLLFVMLVAWAGSIRFPSPTAHPALSLCVEAMVLGFACLVLLHYHYAASAALLLLGLALLGVQILGLYPELPAGYFLGLIVALGVFLFGVWAGALAAIVLTGLLLFMAYRPGAALPPGEASGSILLAWLTLGIVWQGTRPMTTLIAWSWHSFTEARQRSAELEERQARLAQVLKDLDTAYNELAKANRKLALSKTIADEARRAKAEFVANVSHELRTPINMIIGFTEMIVRTPRTYAQGGLPPALLADLDVVLRNAQHLSDLINDILDLSQLDVGRMGLVKEWTPMAEVARAAVAAIEPLARMRGLPIYLEIEEDLPPILADRTRVRQVLLNLLSNAVRFTEAGHIRVHVRRENDQIVASVSDTGPGIATEDIPKLFEPFRQLDGSLRRRFGGTGLGLHISRSFVTLHGGEMAVESRPGEGTTIHFTLPIEDAIPFSALQRGPEPGAPAQTATYVVSEPRPVIEGLLRRYVDNGVVLPAASLREAIKLSRMQPAQGIVLRAAHTREAWQMLEQAEQMDYDAPLIVCSMPGAMEAYSAGLGLAGYLLKPITRQQLQGALDGLAAVQTILIVDDDRDFLRLFARMLKSLRRKYTVWQATSAEEGLALLAERRPDAIFLDVLLPDLEGPLLVKRIRSREALRDVPIFFLTARDATGSPLVANLIGIGHRGGLSADELMRCIQAVGQALTGAIPPIDREPPEAPLG